MKKIKIFLLAVSACFLNITASNIENTDYVQILIYGQSLGMGWEATRAITTEPIDGNYMLGDSPLMRGWFSSSQQLKPLKATMWESGGEQPIVSCVNVFSELYRKNVNASQKFIGMIGGEGGQTIEKLSKECTNNGYYDSSFMKILNSTLGAIKTGETVSCPAIVYVQGEFNCSFDGWNKNQGLTPGTDGTVDKDEYKRLLMILKNNMQADIMQKYGQSKKPLFFIHQASGLYIKDKDMPITMAQLEFAQENDDVFMINPHYGMPDYYGGHLSTNGYRWFGESIAKVLYDTLVEEEPYSPTYPKNFTIEGNTITIDYHVPQPPLVIDTWTTGKVSYSGFSVYNNNSITILKSVEVKDGNKVVIVANKDLTGTDVEIVYAGSRVNGTGNIRDSYNQYTSKYTYFDDSADEKKESNTSTDEQGNPIYGKPYPMYNWSVGFYHKQAAGSSLESSQQHKGITIYPNPTRGVVNVMNKTEDGLISLFDNAGRLLKQTAESKFDISEFADGTYLVKVGEQTIKLVKN